MSGETAGEAREGRNHWEKEHSKPGQNDSPIGEQCQNNQERAESSTDR